jgi:hypothetical protein
VNTLSLPWRRVLIGSWIMILVLTVALIILYVDNKRTRDCIAGYMVADQKNTVARAQLVDTERSAFNHLLAILNDPKTPAQVRRDTFAGYVSLVQADDVLRRQNPPLPVPDRCN